MNKLRDVLGGEFSIVVHKKNGDTKVQVAKNIITDVGIKHLGDILAGFETTDIDLGFIEPGEGTTEPAIGDTDTEDELEGSPTARIAVTAQSRQSSSPFEISIEGFIDSGDYTRPQTISELCVFFTPVGGVLFARALLATPELLSTSDTVTINYSLTFR